MSACRGQRDHAAVARTADAFVAEFPKLVLPAAQAAANTSACVPIAGGDAALSEEARERIAAGYADQAMKHLKRAVELGYSGAKRLATDADFDPLRGRADFRAAEAAVKARAK
jgi:hypothetical protein